MRADAEERWTTVRHLVWQGWDANVPAEWRNRVGDAGRFMVDDDGGLWLEAMPDVCAAEDAHVFRWHPAEIGDWGYCMRCGYQGLAPDGVPWTEEQVDE